MVVSNLPAKGETFNEFAKIMKGSISPVIATFF